MGDYGFDGAGDFAGSDEESHYMVGSVRIEDMGGEVLMREDSDGATAEEVVASIERYLSEVPKGYEELYKEAQLACQQSSHGKGKERHANGRPFKKQPIMTRTKVFGVGFPLGQASKKIEESLKFDPDRQIHELHGAVNYILAACVHLRKKTQDF